MKKLFFLTTIILLAVSCSNDYQSIEPIPSQLDSAQVLVSVSDFEYSLEGFSSSRTRATDVASYEDLKAITLAIFSGDSLVYESTQYRDSTSTYVVFGQFSCHLPLGSFKMVAVGRGVSKGDAFVLTSPVEAGYTSEKVRETFCATKDITVSTTKSLQFSVTLSRVVAMLRIVSTDKRPDNASQVRISFGTGGKSFNPSTGFASVNSGFDIVLHPSTDVGKEISVYGYAFLATNEQTMDVSVQVLDDDDNVLFTRQISDVLLKRNMRTVLKGSVFSNTALTGSAFNIETTWLNDHEIEF